MSYTPMTRRVQPMVRARHPRRFERMGVLGGGGRCVEGVDGCILLFLSLINAKDYLERQREKISGQRV